MHCQRCGYLLFNLTRANCPECAEPFDVADYRFTPGSVTFHCPHCDQPYYGNDPQGLPSPREFQCAECGQDVRLREMRIVPVTPDVVGWAGSIWDNRERVGLWRAWWKTLGVILFHPSRFFRNHTGRSNKEAWLFATISLCIGLFPAMMMAAVILVGLGGVLSNTTLPGGGAAAFPFPTWLIFIFYGVMALLSPFLMQFMVAPIWSGLIQMGLYLMAPQRRAYGDTYRTMLYSFGAYTLHAIPFCGSQAGSIWFFVVLITGLKEVHRTTGGRAAIAVFWPWMALFAIYLLIILGLLIFAHTTGRSPVPA